MAALFATLSLSPALESTAQQSYTCFPTCDATDGRFLALSGTDYNAFTGDEIVVGLGTAADVSHLEIGIFDGESGGMWDFSAAALEYVLYADPLGTGERASEVGRWLGTSMLDNAWHTIRLANVPAARALNGNYVYYLRIRSTDTTVKSTSSFKLRTNGTITIKSHQSFSIYAPLTKLADAYVIYPQYPDRSVTTYDGRWRLFVDVPEASDRLVVWDGDMDHGSYDGYRMDSDDPDTPNELPAWATASARPEGEATSAWAIRDTARPGSTIKMSGDPADDNQNELYRRTPAIRYHVIAPDGSTYANRNPSGNLEWEQFRIATAPFDSTVMDHHADSIPAGIYEVRASGMDMGNVNSWRFFNDVSGVSSLEVLGVDSLGFPVAAIRAPLAPSQSGIAGGVVYIDSDGSGVQAAGEPGIASVSVQLQRHEPNGTRRTVATMTTDNDGRFRFESMAAGTYSVSVDSRSLPKSFAPTSDVDGASSPNTAEVTVAAGSTAAVLPFGYEATSTVGTRTRGYWSNHSSRWPLSSIRLGAIVYSKAEALAILKSPSLGDRTIALASQLIATKLNLARGADASCIGSFVVEADAWLTTYPVGSGSSKVVDWITGEPIHIELDAYNNGLLCAPHEN